MMNNGRKLTQRRTVKPYRMLVIIIALLAMHQASLVRITFNASAAAVAPIPAVAVANLVQNGSFESGFELTTTINGGWPNNAGLWAEIGDNGSPDTIPDWTITGTADWHDSSVPTGQPHAQEGSRLVDLNGSNTQGATLSQTINTMSGARYRLMFYYAGHPYTGCNYQPKAMNVSAGNVSGVFTADPVLEGYANAPNPIWKAGTLIFTAMGDSTTVSFQSLNVFTCAGPLIDNVVVEQALPTTTDQCKNGGWQSFGVFKNQGDCESFVVTNGKNLPAK